MNKPLAIFRVGRQAGEMTEERVRAAVAAYDPALHEAPLVLGHPQHDSPAYGWVSSLNYDESSHLVTAQPVRVQEALVEAVKAGSYRKVSASFYRPGVAENPAPEGYYLRHVGLLGGTPPVIKGLPALELAEAGDADIVTVEYADVRGGVLERLLRSLRDWMIETQSLEKADQILPQHELDYLVAEGDDTHYAEDTMTDTLTAEQLQAKADELAAREAAQAQREQDWEAAETERRRAGIRDFAEGLAKDGKILPRDKDGVIAVLDSLPADTTVNYADESGVAHQAPAADWLREFLARRAPEVQYGELAPADGNATQPGAVTGLKVPSGCEIDQRHADVHKQALQYAEQNQCSYTEAIQAIAR